MHVIPEPRLGRRPSYKATVASIYKDKCKTQSAEETQLCRIFSVQNSIEKISQTYLSHVSKIGVRPIMPIGIYLPLKYFKALYEALTRKQFDIQEEFLKKKQISFMLHEIIEIQDVRILIWIYPVIDSSVSNSLANIFWSYLPLIITTKEKQSEIRQKLTEHRKVTVMKKLIQYQQKISYFQELYSAIDDSFEGKIQKQLLASFKKNSYRVMNQHNIINIYLINSLTLFLNQLNNSQSNPQELIAQQAIANFLTEEVQNKYDTFYEEMENKLPMPDLQIEEAFEKFEENSLCQMRNNLLMLLPSEKVEEYIEQAQMRLKQFKEQIIYKNKGLAELKNKYLIENIFAKFYNKFQTQEYSKDHIEDVATDFEHLLDSYEEGRIISEGEFETFNSFMKKNRAKIYQKISDLETEEENNLSKKRHGNNDEQQILEKIKFKKAMLQGLQQEIKSLDQKKLQIEQKNEKMKKIWSLNDVNTIFESKERKTELVLRDAPSNKEFSINQGEDAVNEMMSDRPAEKKAYKNFDEKKEGKTCCCKCHIF